MKGAPHRRSHTASEVKPAPHFFSRQGAPVVVPEGWVHTGTPGTIGTVSQVLRTEARQLLPCQANRSSNLAPTGAGAAPFPRVPGGLEHAPSGERMASA